MSRLLEQAVEKLRCLPEGEQDELARVLLQLVGEEQPVIQLTPEEERDLADALAEAERGEFAQARDQFGPFARAAAGRTNGLRRPDRGIQKSEP